MKLLQVNKLYSPWVGGVEKVVQQIAEGLNTRTRINADRDADKRGWRRRIDDINPREPASNNICVNLCKYPRESASVEVLCCDHNKKGKEEEINGVKVHRAPSFGVFWGMPISFSFFSLFKKLSQKVDLIDFHHPFPLGDLAIFLFKPKTKLIVHYHSDIVRQKIFEIFFKPLIFNTLKKAEKIIVSNPNLIESSSYLRKFKQKCQIIPFGVDLKKFQENQKIFEKAKKIKEKYHNCPIILSVGRLTYYKGFSYLIEAIHNLKHSNILKNIGIKFPKCLIIGKGKLKERLLKLIKKLSLQNDVFILPPQKDLLPYYLACDLFVLPSIFKSEAFGIVLIEAMACGKPVISTELGTGTSWININEKTGFVVPPKDSRSLAKAINKILENKKLAEQFSKNAKKRVKENFSLDKMLKETEGVYREIVLS